MQVIKKKDISLASELNLLISEEIGAKYCQAGIARISIGRSLPENGYSKHPTEEVCYIVKGKVRVETKRLIQDLEEGDIVFIEENEEHRNVNIGEEEALIFWVTVPPTL